MLSSSPRISEGVTIFSDLSHTPATTMTESSDKERLLLAVDSSLDSPLGNPSFGALDPLEFSSGQLLQHLVVVESLLVVISGNPAKASTVGNFTGDNLSIDNHSADVQMFSDVTVVSSMDGLVVVHLTLKMWLPNSNCPESMTVVLVVRRVVFLHQFCSTNNFGVDNHSRLAVGSDGKTVAALVSFSSSSSSFVKSEQRLLASGNIAVDMNCLISGHDSLIDGCAE